MPGEPALDSDDQDCSADTPALGVEAANEPAPAPRGVRERPPERRASETIKMHIGGHTHYMSVGYYDDGRPCEVFIRTGKAGQTLRGYTDALGIVISHYLQIGGDVVTIADKLSGSLFDPSGPVTGAPLGIDRASSPVDALAQLLLKLQGCDE